jgi:spore germination cell wall hydrolase CwlJ-like protein
MLAVANVVINRVNSSKYPNSISGVIYAAGQFSPVSSGKLDTRLSKGPSSTAVQAASDALNGTNNIGSFVHFRSSKGADLTAYSSYTIVGGNVFH